MKKRICSHGFTLVELMFSLAAGAMILLAAVVMLGSSADGYARVGNQVSDERQYRLLMSGLASECASAVFHKDMRVRRAQSPWPAAQLGFLTLAPPDAQRAEHRIGDLCAVHYYMKDLTVAGRVERCLMRGFHDSRQTFDSLRGDAVHELFVTDGPTDEPIAQRVVSFDAAPVVMGQSRRWEDAPLPLRAAPQAMRIRLVIARPALAATLATSTEWDALVRDDPRLEVFESVLPFRCHEGG